jgi:hypothetical protein
MRKQEMQKNHAEIKATHTRQQPHNSMQSSVTELQAGQALNVAGKT